MPGPCCSTDLARSQPELVLTLSVSTRTGCKPLDIRTTVCSPLHLPRRPSTAPGSEGLPHPSFLVERPGRPSATSGSSPSVPWGREPELPETQCRGAPLEHSVLFGGMGGGSWGPHDSDSQSCSRWEGRVHAAVWRRSTCGWGPAPAAVSPSTLGAGQCLSSGCILKLPPLAAPWQTVQEWKISQGRAPPAPQCPCRLTTSPLSSPTIRLPDLTRALGVARECSL